MRFEKLSGQLLGLIMMSYWLGGVWIRIWDGSIILPLSFVHLENHVCFSRGVQVAGAAWRAAMRIVTVVGDLVQRIEDGRTSRVLGDCAIERLGDTVCGLHRARGDEERKFFSWASKPRSTVCEWFGHKTTRMVSHRFWHQNRWWWFVSGLASKPLGWFSLVWPQNRWWQFSPV
jgi:hypothetical protein